MYAGVGVRRSYRLRDFCGVSAFGAVMDGEYDKATFFSMGLAVNAIAYGVTKAEMEFDE